MSLTDYVEGLKGANKQIIQHLYGVVRDMLPEVTEGVSYGMPALRYKQKALISFMETKHHLSCVPFSPAAIVAVQKDLAGFETTKGNVHFSATKPLSDDVVRNMVRYRAKEIESKAK
jgi:uncharacterized protein YdhG (YjbR/CyaY superfamily)